MIRSHWLDRPQAIDVVGLGPLTPGQAETPSDRLRGVLVRWVATQWDQLAGTAYRYHRQYGRGVCVLVEGSLDWAADPIRYVEAERLLDAMAPGCARETVAAALRSYDPGREVLFAFRTLLVHGADLVFIRAAHEPGPATAHARQLN